MMEVLLSLAERYNYVITIFLMMAGLYIVIARGTWVKKLVRSVDLPDLGLPALHRTGKDPGRLGAHHRSGDHRMLINPLPHVLIFTAIVVGLHAMALGLATGRFASTKATAPSRKTRSREIAGP